MEVLKVVDFGTFFSFNINKMFINIGKGNKTMKYVHMRINELLKEKSISKNRTCKDLELARGNFNRYCRDEFQRIDANLILKLCDYLECDIADLLEIINLQ